MGFSSQLAPRFQGVFLKAKPELRPTNIREAIAGYLKSLRKQGEPVPPGIEEQVVEIAAAGDFRCRCCKSTA